MDASISCTSVRPIQLDCPDYYKQKPSNGLKKNIAGFIRDQTLTLTLTPYVVLQAAMLKSGSADCSTARQLEPRQQRCKTVLSLPRRVLQPQRPQPKSHPHHHPRDLGASNRFRQAPQRRNRRQHAQRLQSHQITSRHMTSVAGRREVHPSSTRWTRATLTALIHDQNQSPTNPSPVHHFKQLKDQSVGRDLTDRRTDRQTRFRPNHGTPQSHISPGAPRQLDSRDTL